MVVCPLAFSCRTLTFKKVCFICLSEAMKNAFHLILKALYVLEIFKFFSSFFGHVEKQPDQKDLFQKFMTSQPN